MSPTDQGDTAPLVQTTGVLGTARVVLSSERTVGAVDRRLFGGFVEHMGRGVYGGIYAPDHPSADGEGFRQDVIELVRELGMTTFRYPGGNFVSGFKWEDSVGPREDRPTRLNLAWQSRETNQVGLHEFSSWLDKVGGELMLAVNLGTRGTLEAIELLEYSNIRHGTSLASMRITNGRVEPFGVRMWCLGNEMDGPWQLGQQSAEDYGKLASKTARAMRQVDADLQIVACGSSHSGMPTFGEWERTVLAHAYDDIDYLSCHAYYEPIDGDLASFLASAVNMDRFIHDVIATVDHVRAARKSSRQIDISFDEWNVWYQSRLPAPSSADPGDWPTAPPISEDRYTVADGVVVGDLLMSLVRRADRVKSASLAQVVNVIAPIAAPPTGPAWRQSTFFPFALTQRHATGESLDVLVQTETVSTKAHGAVSVVSAAATWDRHHSTATVFLVNRGITEAVEVTVEMTGALVDLRMIEALTLSDDDPSAHNSSEHPSRVSPAMNDRVVAGEGWLRVTLPPVSWTMVRLGESTAEDGETR